MYDGKSCQQQAQQQQKTAQLLYTGQQRFLFVHLTKCASGKTVAICETYFINQTNFRRQPVAYLGFCEGGGGQSQRREVRGAGGANGWSVGRGCPSPLKKGSGCAPSPEIFFKFFLVQCVQKIFVFRPKGGASPSAPPPKYATGDSSLSL